ncbi:MAG: tRNA (adenosine(37)-N6)-threonylcarbamoyltransferase complex dimerization subunit type 1 TsaB [Clostridiaceae bacterium]|nr:tRNA (adenosine(37)-N6)-threonylcarbamoyltransferase complex dimerization subunit type 1 TsaB [Clostridiaceae bacterium]
MKVLALETSSLVASVALVEDRILLGESILKHKKKSLSRELVFMIRDMLDGLEVRAGDIDLFAVSKGPGSFTGLRIGVTTAKAMAYALDKPIIGVPTLDALAYNVPTCEHIICPVMDARNNQVYTALYQWSSNIGHRCRQRLSGYMGLKIEELVGNIRAMVDKTGQKVIFTGDGIIPYGDYFTKELGDKCAFTPYGLMFQRASSVAEIALDLFLEGKQDDCFSLVPFYLRKSQAERMRESEETRLESRNS